MTTKPAAAPETFTAQRMVREAVAALAGPPCADLAVEGAGSLPSAFPVTDLAVASIGTAGLALAGFLHTAGIGGRQVAVDRRLASFWFAASLRPQGWAPPPPWDPIAGDYACADGWIRLHTNAPRHREAALRVLGTAAAKEAVADAVREWPGDRLEDRIVAAGGCAAFMRSHAAWTASAQGSSVAAEPLIGWETLGTAPWAPACDPAKPLAGLRVLDLTRVLAGPVATRLLAALGADVLRVDPPDWDEPGIVPEVMAGKRGTRLDLREEAARTRFTRLMGGCDLLVHGYRPAALDGLGFGEARRREINPRMVEVTLDAYGWSGPWRARRGFDSLVQMSCGIAEAGMRRFGRDRPTPLPVQALDHATGYLMAAAALSALARRLRTGEVMRARLSLARTAALLMAHAAGDAAEPAPETAADLDPVAEATFWGPALRLKPPLAVEGVDLRPALPAMPLGSHDARWTV